MFVKKTPNEIINNALSTLVENTPIDNLFPGSISRTIIESFAYELGSDAEGENFYDIAGYILKNAYLGSVDNEHIDLIGQLLDYPRREIEVYNSVTRLYSTQLIDDDTYRYEISKRVHTIASANEEALRLALLAINGVKDVIGEEYTHGTGSFSFVVIPMVGYSNHSILDSAKVVTQATKSFGVKYEIKMPTEVTIDVNVQLVMKESSTGSDILSANSSTKTALINFFEQYEVGQGFIYNDFVQEIMNSDEKVIDFKVLSFYMNGEPVLLTNQSVAEDERIRPGSIVIV